MESFQKHLRGTFLAGIFAAIPLGITAFIIWKLWEWSDKVSDWLFSQKIPLIGLVLAIAVIYALGLLVNTLLGKFILGVIDGLLSRIPVLRQLYAAWKQVALTPGGTEGVFSKVALVPDEFGHLRLLGFTTGRPITGDENTWPVLILSAPNPTTGRLYFIHRDKCQLLDLSTEEAFKIILSGGNYVPEQVGAATALATAVEQAERVP